MNMINEKNTAQMQLKLYGWLFIVLAVLDVAMMVLELVGTGVSALLGELGVGAVIFMVALFALTLVVTLIKFWMGLQGVRYGNGNGKGKSHITFAKIAVWLFVIFVAMGVADVITGSGSIGDVIPDVVSLILVWFYMKAAKECLN